MQSFDFLEPDAALVHQCDSYRKGDWIVFRCPSCHDYERKINWKTGEVSVKNSREHVLHEGKHVPFGLDTSAMN